MPYYLDFDSTKNFRDKLLARTLDPIYGNSPSPKTFNNKSYSEQNLSDLPNILQPAVDTNRLDELTSIATSNVYKPNEYSVKDTLIDLPRRANLSLYPYFIKSDENLISIMATNSYNTESELFKFAAKYIQQDPNGPVLARIQQNLYSATTAKVRIADALEGNFVTLQAILRGREPLVEGNNKITVSSSILGKGIDFLGTVAGTQLPWSEISGDYLTNPRNPINVRPTNVSNATKIWQDLTGVLGSVIGIQRRPLPTRKPSDILIQSTGNSTLARLYDALSYNDYAPNYTTTARSQQSSKLFNYPNQFAQGVKNLIGMEAPAGIAYIGDDRSHDVKNAMSDLLSGRPVRSPYYLSLMFDPISTELFHNDKNTMDQGRLDGSLTWISKKTSNKYNKNAIQGGESFNYSGSFRPDSILYTTQDILDSVPSNGAGAFSHIGHIMDQTSKFFVEGSKLVSRGSAVKYTLNGKDVGAEFARVWTKDRPYRTYGSTAPYIDDVNTPYYSGATGNYFRRKNIRKFDGSVLSNTWNLNIAPNSDGTKNFTDSTNISDNYKFGGGFYAKKYMLSIENLAWKNTHLPGFTVNDLPYSERGPNGGRVMWFPPYDVKVNEVSTATWERNNFLGRPEPIYTYQNTERSATLSFKIVVDHPSILNLLVREHFKTMSDEQADNYIHSFFAGVKDVDFYSLIRTYANLDTNDITTIKNYLNSNSDPNQLSRYNVGVSPKTAINPNTTDNSNNVNLNIVLNFGNADPQPTEKSFMTGDYYAAINKELLLKKSKIIEDLNTGMDTIITGTDEKSVSDRKLLFGTVNATADSKPNIVTKLSDLIDTSTNNFSTLLSQLESLKTELNNNIVKNDVIIKIGSSSSHTCDFDITNGFNYSLSVRRAYSVLLSIIAKINVSTNKESDILSKNWSETANSDASGYEHYIINASIPLEDLGYKGNNNSLIIRTISYGEKVQNNGIDCSATEFNNTNLKRSAPVMYGCRASNVTLSYFKKTTNETTAGNNTKTPTQIIINNIQGQNQKPPLEEMKKIIMKTLSEQYYFKVLKEGNPIIYNSLREKLKYFHPTFHSMTPEGLNGRLTFLQQCLRPGDTIPVKGVADNSDIGARNTTFGPPPICILRIGDFYHSKVVIRDLNINFDEGGWDLNPEGIGVQPMIASVQMQLNFIGGQGLEAPVERLQNALSSNFYGNTEMYDERSINTTTSINLTGATAYSKEFLNSLNNQIVKKAATKNQDGTSKFIEGKYLGTLITNNVLGTLDYTPLITTIYGYTKNYFITYSDLYNTIASEFGAELAPMMIDSTYRPVNQYNVSTPTGPITLNLFGYINKYDYNTLVQSVRNQVMSSISTTGDTISTILNYTDLISDTTLLYTINENVINYFLPLISSKFDEIDRYDFSPIEKIRYKLIKSLDNLNYLIDNQIDITISGGTAYSATLNNFTAQDLYDSYSDCITYINSQNEKMYNDLDDTFDFTDNQICCLNYPEIALILASFFNDKVDEIMNIIKDTMNLGDEDTTIVEIKKRINVVLTKKKTSKNFKFSKAPIRKNEKSLSYNISVINMVELTNTMKLLFSRQNPVNNTLNYYRNE
jgi:hypothetical protein